MNAYRSSYSYCVHIEYVYYTRIFDYRPYAEYAFYLRTNSFTYECMISEGNTQMLQKCVRVPNRLSKGV